MLRPLSEVITSYLKSAIISGPTVRNALTPFLQQLQSLQRGRIGEWKLRLRVLCFYAFRLIRGAWNTVRIDTTVIQSPLFGRLGSSPKCDNQH